MEVRPIDANALAEVLNEMIADYTEFQSGGFFAHGIRKGLNDAYRATINFPTLDYAPVKHGVWRQHKLSVPKGRGQTYIVYGCSLCHKHERKRSDYCPNCGAKMDGGKG